MRGSASIVACVALLSACGGGPTRPVEIDTRGDACAWCRMAVSDVRFAAQLVAPAEEPRLFDDLGCLKAYLEGGARVPRRAIAYVADHGTGTWVVAARAVYARVPGLATPMASGLVAHADAGSRSRDPDARAGVPLDVRDVFGSAPPPEGRP